MAISWCNYDSHCRYNKLEIKTQLINWAFYGGGKLTLDGELNQDDAVLEFLRGNRQVK